MKKAFIRTMGCQMNVYDSSRMMDILRNLGYEETSEYTEADLILVNTCHIREKASEKVFSELGRYGQLKKHRPDLIIVVAGCVVQAEGEELQERATFVDIALGPQNYHHLPEKLELIRRKTKKQVIEADFPAQTKFDFLPAPGRQAYSAYLAIQEGCDRFCSYCVVPYTRGAEYSRPAADIIREAEAMTEAGAKEITLLGQNVNAWHGIGTDGKIWRLEDLIPRLAELPKLLRIRFVTSYPSDMTQELLQCFADYEKLMPYLHLPVQSGSDKVLKAMNRRYTSAEYLDIVYRLKDICPEIALSSDFIVGFPGEEDSDFAQTMDLVEKVGFASSFSFKYSPRPGTPGAAMKGQIPEKVKAERLDILQALLQSEQKAFNQNCIGKILPVLLEHEGKSQGQLCGRSPYLQNVNLPADKNLLGTIIPVKITKSTLNSLSGEIAL
ncbi:MAG: tRNA (N6-isopentenyl adenosine(37)-C2)-methylthiotransferase MiaB [Alphaproteobacteria bacterium]|nr:tRNA (N6-isopentenyl adenosine(37)-C2)-methylthiotransferase MiaB [Alphaproteobacteria bacterium]